jgi:hypothetical protein
MIYVLHLCTSMYGEGPPGLTIQSLIALIVHLNNLRANIQWASALMTGCTAYFSY